MLVLRGFRIIYGKHKIFIKKSKLLSRNETDEIGKVTDDLDIKWSIVCIAISCWKVFKTRDRRRGSVNVLLRRKQCETRFYEKRAKN